MSRTRVRRRRLAVLATGAVVAGFWAGPLASAFGDPHQPAAVSQQRYVVRAGDTLWSIAARLAPGQDPRPVTDAIQTANHLDPGALVPGQSIVIPPAG
jgi:nucleoid-associated protein YgaU